MAQFIVKAKNMAVIPGVGPVMVPTHINRNNVRGGWQIDGRGYPDIEERFFSDFEYRTPLDSLEAAISEIERRNLMLRTGRAFETDERAYKIHKLGVVGVFYSVFYDEKKKQVVHQFRVNDPSINIATTVYIGNDNTYLDNWDEALDKAVKLRAQFEHEYTVKHYWAGTSYKNFLLRA